MFPALNAWTLPDLTPAAQLAAAAAAGFGGLELTVSADGPLRPETPTSEYADLRRQAADLGLRLVGVASGLFFQTNYASPAAAAREAADALTLRLLDAAATAGAAAILVIPAIVGRATDPAPRVAYADALARSCEALLRLRHEAEARDVTIALETVWNRFLLSPVEAAELLDRVNSPRVAMYLDIGNVMAYGYPQDWIATLGRHVARVHAKDYDVTRPGRDGFCPLGTGSVDWPAVIGTLQRVGYDGPLTYEGPGEPAEVCRRLNNILAGRPAAEDPA